jgi:ribonuclease HI
VSKKGKTKKPKFYVVWEGRETGIFENWEDCKTQVHGFEGAIYKSFTTRQLAEEAFVSSSKDFIGKNPIIENELTEMQKTLIGQPILKSISVDGAWNTSTGIVEYRGVNTKTKEILFEVGPFEDGTNNIAEFLAIVHGLAYCKKNSLSLPIYSDSQTAIGWVRDKQARTNHEMNNKNKKTFELIDRAIIWLNENDYPNKVLKWETTAWGENPADFGRK